mmetsp:Transcript_120269/g.256711  ORF Transcript_120269/g.256711 Transcript_120269/m.256711 type:complete len:204 (+) Transcript_120269:422-1033(+)
MLWRPLRKPGPQSDAEAGRIKCPSSPRRGLCGETPRKEAAANTDLQLWWCRRQGPEAAGTELDRCTLQRLLRQARRGHPSGGSLADSHDIRRRRSRGGNRQATSLPQGSCAEEAGHLGAGARLGRSCEATRAVQADDVRCLVTDQTEALHAPEVGLTILLLAGGLSGTACGTGRWPCELRDGAARRCRRCRRELQAWSRWRGR